MQKQSQETLNSILGIPESGGGAGAARISTSEDAWDGSTAVDTVSAIATEE
jgi:hypothetical protein